MLKKFFLGSELSIGILLILCVLFNNKTSPINIGMDLNLKNGTMIVGIFYFLKEIANFVIVHAEATTPPFIQSFLMILEIVIGFFMSITSYCHDKITFIESLLNVDLTINYGIAALGLLYIFKSLSKVILSSNNLNE